MVNERLRATVTADGKCRHLAPYGVLMLMHTSPMRGLLF